MRAVRIGLTLKKCTRNFYLRDFLCTFSSRPTLFYFFTAGFPAKARDGPGESTPSWCTFWQFLGILACKKRGFFWTVRVTIVNVTFFLLCLYLSWGENSYPMIPYHYPHKNSTIWGENTLIKHQKHHKHGGAVQCYMGMAMVNYPIPSR